jgi:hypothetical protein
MTAFQDLTWTLAAITIFSAAAAFALLGKIKPEG